MTQELKSAVEQANEIGYKVRGLIDEHDEATNKIAALASAEGLDMDEEIGLNALVIRADNREPDEDGDRTHCLYVSGTGKVRISLIMRLISEMPKQVAMMTLVGALRQLGGEE